MVTPMDLEHILSELDGILERFRELSGMDNGRPADGSSGDDLRVLIKKAITAVRKISGSESDYTMAIAAVAEEKEGTPGREGLVFGVVKALRDDIRHGRFQPVSDPVFFDAGTFGGFLNVAMQQLSRGDYKAAAVLAGSTLETHLRKLASRNGLDFEDPDGKPLPVDQVVQDLVESGVMDGEERRRVEDWLALREAASADKTEQISADQIGAMIAGVKAFLVRNPV